MGIEDGIIGFGVGILSFKDLGLRISDYGA